MEWENHGAQRGRHKQARHPLRRKQPHHPRNLLKYRRQALFRKSLQRYPNCCLDHGLWWTVCGKLFSRCIIKGLSHTLTCSRVMVRQFQMHRSVFFGCLSRIPLMLERFKWLL